MRKLFILGALSSLLIAGCASDSDQVEAAAGVAFETQQEHSDGLRRGGPMETTLGDDDGSYVATAHSPGREDFQPPEQQVNVASQSPTFLPVQLPALRNRAVIRRAELEVRVKNVEEAEKQLNAVLERLGGYLENAASTDLAGADAALTLTARVPAGQFDAAIAQFQALGVRLSKKVSSEDVTKELIDMDARVSTFLAEEETVRNMLRRATNMNQILQLQSKLSELRSTIESIAGQRKALGEAAALSTITVTLRQSASPASQGQDPNWLAQAYAEASSSAAGLLRSVITWLVWALLYSPAWGAALLVGWVAYRRYRQPRSKGGAAPAWDISAGGRL